MLSRVTPSPWPSRHATCSGLRPSTLACSIEAYSLTVCSASRERSTLHVTFGPRWCSVATCLPQRTEQAVRNRWNRLQQRARVQARTMLNAFQQGRGMAPGLPNLQSSE